MDPSSSSSALPLRVATARPASRTSAAARIAATLLLCTLAVCAVALLVARHSRSLPSTDQPLVTVMVSTYNRIPFLDHAVTLIEEQGAFALSPCPPLLACSLTHCFVTTLLHPHHPHNPSPPRQPDYPNLEILIVDDSPADYSQTDAGKAWLEQHPIVR